MEKRRRGEDSWAIAIISDSALTGGTTWEGLNRLAALKDRRVLIIVNNNGRSYAPTIGGLALHLDALRASGGYERAPSWDKRQLLSLGEPGRAAFDALHAVKTGLKDALVPQIMFEDLGLKYLGPVDGHDIVALENELMLTKTQRSPVILHAIIQKGRGYTPAEEDIVDRFRAVDPIRPETDLPVAPARFSWTSVFAEEIVRVTQENSKVVGIAAAMMEPADLAPIKKEFPERVVDVGIVEQEALASAAGVAYEGAHPVVALYVTFLSRAFDQLLMDIALHQTRVTIALSRVGITGIDGASHNGTWDIAMRQIIPGLKLYAPRDEASLRHSLRLAIAVEDRPTVVRYPKGSLPGAMSTLRTMEGVDALSKPDPGAVGMLLVATRTLAPSGLKTARILEEQGIRVRVVDPIRVLPLKEGLLEYAKNTDLVVTIKDGLVDGGFGWALHDRCVGARVLTLGITKTFLEHGDRLDILAAPGLDPESIAQRIREGLGDAWAG